MAPTLPTTIGHDVDVNPSSSVASYDPNIISRAVMKTGEDIEGAADAALKGQTIQAMQDATARKNQADRKVINFLYGDGTPENPGLYSYKGAAARDAGQKFDEFYATVKSDALSGVTNPVAAPIGTELYKMQQTSGSKASD